MSSPGDEKRRACDPAPDVDKVSFTGSTATGRRIASLCGEQLKRVSLVLGGKSAAVVLDDADIATMAEGLRFASFANNGKTCVAQTRIPAPQNNYDAVVDARNGCHTPTRASCTSRGSSTSTRPRLR